MRGISFGASLLIGVTCASTQVFADSLLGLYFGAAIGESHVRTAKEINGDTNYESEFDQAHSAWKVTAGIRPISPLGVELEYIDFGNPSSSTNSGFGEISRADAKALALFGVGYLPLPAPFLTVYGKFGISRLHTTATEVPPPLSAGAPRAAPALAYPVARLHTRYPISEYPTGPPISPTVWESKENSESSPFAWSMSELARAAIARASLPWV